MSQRIFLEKETGGTSRLASAMPAMVVATAVALILGVNFRSYLPMPEGWGRIKNILFPLAYTDYVLHEGGHMVFLLFHVQVLHVLGGTLVQLLFPIACWFHFRKRRESGASTLMLFWLGFSLVGTGFYMADAKHQYLLLNIGLTGWEDGIHDWHYLLGLIGLRRWSAGIGSLPFVAGCWLMVFSLARLVMRLWERQEANHEDL